MGYRTISQIAMVIAAVFLVFVVVKPKLSAIKVVEDEAAQYQDAVQKAEEYNRSLAALVSKKDSFTRDELERLEQYLPSSIDTVAVMSDIKAFADTSGLEVLGVGVVTSDNISDSSGTDEGNTDEYFYDENGEEQIAEKAKTSYKDFELSAQGSYVGIKTLLSVLENNQYPLEVVALNLSVQDSDSEDALPTAGPVFTYSLKLRAYSFTN